MLETKIDVKKTAILVIDMQNDAVKATHPSFSELAQRIQAEGIVGHIAKVIAAARSSGMSVVYVNMVSRMDGTDRLGTVTDVTRRAGGSSKPIMAEGMPGAEVVKELKPAEGGLHRVEAVGEQLLRHRLRAAAPDPRDKYSDYYWDSHRGLCG